jgi:hypothetical protein
LSAALRLGRLLLLASALSGGSSFEASLAAQTVVTSDGPNDVDITIYRAPGRGEESELDLEWLEGYALISETRQVSIPAGESEIRFEGVAGGILPQSAIVTGFPEGIVERNRDAYLLSPESLLDRSLGRRVHLRRTSSATGEVREQDAVIRSGADGAVVLQTSDGFEALRCTGLPEALVYDQVPAGLSTRPTLSVRARSSQAVSATVTLSYLANGFDWQANYVATLSPAGDRVDLFAWLTLANSDETSFRDADTQAVAGRLNREQVEIDEPQANALQLQCWPQGRTSDIVLQNELPQQQAGMRRARLGATRTEGYVDAADESIMVTGTVLRAEQEDLGDLKLYRIPEPVTVAAHSQKQVAFLRQPAVQVDFVYRNRLGLDDADDPTAAERVLVTRNRSAEGLGIPLPAGGMQLFTSAGGRPILLGEGTVEDLAVGEDVEIRLGEAPGVRAVIEDTGFGDDWEDHVMTVTNDRSVPVRYEAEFEVEEDEELRPGRRLGRRDGRPLWAVTVPANGTATLRYRVVERDD